MKLNFFNKRRIASLGGALILLTSSFNLTASAKKGIDKNILGINASVIASENIGSLEKERTASIELNIVDDNFMPLSGVKYNIIDENGKTIYNGISVLGKNNISNLPYDGNFYVECVSVPDGYVKPEFGASFEIKNGKIVGNFANIQLHKEKENKEESLVGVSHCLCEKEYFNSELLEGTKKGCLLIDFYNMGNDCCETILNFVVVDKEDGSELIPKYSSSVNDQMGYFFVKGLKEGHKYEIEFKCKDNKIPYLPASSFVYDYDFEEEEKDVDDINNYYEVSIVNYAILSMDDALKYGGYFNYDCDLNIYSCNLENKNNSKIYSNSYNKKISR